MNVEVHIASPLIGRSGQRSEKSLARDTINGLATETKQAVQQVLKRHGFDLCLGLIDPGFCPWSTYLSDSERHCSDCHERSQGGMVPKRVPIPSWWSFFFPEDPCDWHQQYQHWNPGQDQIQRLAVPPVRAPCYQCDRSSSEPVARCPNCYQVFWPVTRCFACQLTSRKEQRSMSPSRSKSLNHPN